jgi:hypothetical protein
MDNPAGRVAGVPDASAREGGAESLEGNSGDVDQRTQQIRQEIDQTRAELSETIDAIQDRLKPANVVASATDSVKSAATQRVRDMAETANETAQQAMDYTRQRANQAMGSARQNSIPLAMIGIGAAWLLANRSRHSSGGSGRSTYATGDYGYGNYAEDWSDANSAGWREDSSEPGVVERAREYASQTTGNVRRMARQRQNQLWRAIDENPLLVGAGALMLGAALGLAVPETEAENEWMGEARDTVVNRARDMARDAAEHVQNTASSVADAAKKASDRTQP